jgi:hypothetical protein
VARRETHKPRILGTKAGKAPGVENLHIRNDSTSAQVKERAKKYIKVGKLSNIITTSHYGVPAMVRSTN